jgi:hypothetical protein
MIVLFSPSKAGTWRMEMHRRALEELEKLRDQARLELRAAAEEAMGSLFAESEDYFGRGSSAVELTGEMRARNEQRLLGSFQNFGFSSQEEASQFFHSAEHQVRRSISLQWVEHGRSGVTMKMYSFIAF